jgi:hypothetical protein
MFTIIGAMAELERNVIRERVVAGIEHARVHGTKSGSAIGRPRAVFDRAAVVEMRQSGRSWRQIAATLSISLGTVRRVYGQGVPKPSAKETVSNGAIKRVAGAVFATHLGLIGMRTGWTPGPCLLAPVTPLAPVKNGQVGEDGAAERRESICHNNTQNCTECQVEPILLSKPRRGFHQIAQALLNDFPLL